MILYAKESLLTQHLAAVYSQPSNKKWQIIILSNKTKKQTRNRLTDKYLTNIFKGQIISGNMLEGEERQGSQLLSGNGHLQYHK